MNPIQEINNNNAVEIKFNVGVMLDALDLGPPPQMVRTPSHNVYGDFPLIADDSFPDFQNNQDNFIMPEPCGKCYSIICNGDCDEEKAEISHQPLTRVLTSAAYYYYKPGEELKEEESEMELPIQPPHSFRRMYTNSHLPPDEPEDQEVDK